MARNRLLLHKSISFPTYLYNFVYVYIIYTYVEEILLGLKFIPPLALHTLLTFQINLHFTRALLALNSGDVASEENEENRYSLESVDLIAMAEMKRKMKAKLHKRINSIRQSVLKQQHDNYAQKKLFLEWRTLLNKEKDVGQRRFSSVRIFGLFVCMSHQFLSVYVFILHDMSDYHIYIIYNHISRNTYRIR